MATMILARAGWIIVQGECNQACLNCWAAADDVNERPKGAHSPGQAKRHPGFPMLVQSRPERAKALNVHLGVSTDSNNFVTQISFQCRENVVSVPHFPRIINTKVTFLNILTKFYPPRLEYSLYVCIFAPWTRDVFKFCYLIFNNLTSLHVTHSSNWLKITLT